MLIEYTHLKRETINERPDGKTLSVRTRAEILSIGLFFDIPTKNDCTSGDVRHRGRLLCLWLTEVILPWTHARSTQLILQPYTHTHSNTKKSFLTLRAQYLYHFILIARMAPQSTHRYSDIKQQLPLLHPTPAMLPKFYLHNNAQTHIPLRETSPVHYSLPSGYESPKRTAMEAAASLYTIESKSNYVRARPDGRRERLVYLTLRAAAAGRIGGGRHHYVDGDAQPHRHG